MKLADANCESCKCAPFRHVKMVATTSATSLQQTLMCCSNGIQSTTMHGINRRQSADFVAKTNQRQKSVNFHGMCPRQSLRTLPHSQHNGTQDLKASIYLQHLITITQPITQRFSQEMIRSNSMQFRPSSIRSKQSMQPLAVHTAAIHP